MCIRRGAPFVLLLLWACADGSPSLDWSYSFTEIARYGEAGVDGVTSDGAGSVLADIAAVVTDDEGRVYVLDRDWKTIVVFAPDGAFERVIHGGDGEGPGEFRLPVDLTWADDRISVLDYQLNRVTWFDEEGLDGMYQLDRRGFLRHAIVGDSIFLTGPGAKTSPIVSIQTVSGAEVALPPPLAEEDRPFGTAIGIATMASGNVLLSTRRPGVWMILRDGSWSRRGAPLFPDMEPPVEEVTGPNQITVTPAQADAASIAALGDTLVIQGYMQFTRAFDWDDPPGPDETEHYAAIFSLDGALRGTVRFPAGAGPRCLFVAPRSNHVYLCTDDPFPQVVEYALEATLAGR